MMTAKLHHRISRLLQRTVANFCRERVSFDRKLRVVGLVALSIDDDDVDILVKMDETFTKENDVCDEDDDEEDIETMDYDTERKHSPSPVVLVDSSTSAPGTAPSAGAAMAAEYEGEEILSSPLPDALSPQSRRVGSPIETREEADTNFCLLEDEEEVVPLPPPLSSVIDRLHDDVDGCVTDDLELTCNDRIQICTSTSIVTPLFHHKQKRKRFRPMRLYQPDNGYVVSVTGGSHSSEDPPSPSPYLPSGSDYMLPDLVSGGSPNGSLNDPKTTVDLPLPPLPSSDTGSGEDAMDLSEEPIDDDPDTRAIVLNGIDSSPGTVDGTADHGDLIPMSPVPGDVVEEVEVSSAMMNDDEDLQITGEYCRLPTLPLMPTLPPPPRPPPPQAQPPSLTSVTLPLLSLPLTGPTGALNSIPLIPLRQVTNAGTTHNLVNSSPNTINQSTHRQFALIAPGTGILLPSSLSTGHPQQQQPPPPLPSQQHQTAATILATATKSLTVTATVPTANSVNSSFSSANSIISSLAVSTSSSCSSTTTTTSSTAASRSNMLSSSMSKSKTLSILSSSGASGPRGRRSALKFHHSPITIPAAAAALRPLPTMTTGSSVASSLMRHYNCRYCGKMFNRKFCLERHERLHTGVKPYACSCCGERFIRLEDKKRHVRTVHEPSPPGGVDEKSSNGLDGISSSATSTVLTPTTSSGNSATGTASTSAHMLSIITAVAAAAAAASSSSSTSTERKMASTKR